MKKQTYKILSHLPIIGSVFRTFTDPIGLFGSNEIASGYTNRVLSLYEEYLKTHPKEQLTRQLVEKLLSGQNKE